MQTIQVKDKMFRMSMPECEIKQQVCRVAKEINRDFSGQCPVFLAVLNGSFVFAADLLREVTLPCEVSFVKLSSYEGVSSTGQVNEILGLNVDVTGRPVIIVEDIVETGDTMAYMLEMLKSKHPSSVDICALLLKPECLQVEMNVRYRCFDIPNDFIVGYGLDYDGFGRNLKDIYSIVK